MFKHLKWKTSHTLYIYNYIYLHIHKINIGEFYVFYSYKRINKKQQYKP